MFRINLPGRTAYCAELRSTSSITQNPFTRLSEVYRWVQISQTGTLLMGSVIKKLKFMN
jgi:hypothetical protein